MYAANRAKTERGRGRLGWGLLSVTLSVRVKKKSFVQSGQLHPRDNGREGLAEVSRGEFDGSRPC